MPTSPIWKMTKYNRLKSAGLCPSCGKERDSKFLHCNPCLQIYRKASDKWKRKKSADFHRNRMFVKKYKITLAERDRLFLGQACSCAICGTDTPSVRWTVDHCHSSNMVRGILCHPCNVGLGQFKDDPDLLDAAAAYLRKHKALRAV